MVLCFLSKVQSDHRSCIGIHQEYLARPLSQKTIHQEIYGLVCQEVSVTSQTQDQPKAKVLN